VLSSGGEAALLIAAEIESDNARFADYISRAFGWNPAISSAAKIDYPSGNERLLQTLEAQANQLTGVVVVIPAERPPIRAIALFLERIAQAVRPQRQIVVLLVGKVNGDSFDDVDRDTLRYWQNFVAVNNLNISLETWIRA
jgi:hypothetical protein